MCSKQAVLIQHYAEVVSAPRRRVLFEPEARLNHVTPRPDLWRGLARARARACVRLGATCHTASGLLATQADRAPSPRQRGPTEQREVREDGQRAALSSTSSPREGNLNCYVCVCRVL